MNVKQTWIVYVTDGDNQPTGERYEFGDGTNAENHRQAVAKFDELLFGRKWVGFWASPQLTCRMA